MEEGEGGKQRERERAASNHPLPSFVLKTQRLESQNERRVSPFQDEKPRKRDTRDMNRTRKRHGGRQSRSTDASAKARNLAPRISRPEPDASWKPVDRGFTGACLFAAGRGPVSSRAKSLRPEFHQHSVHQGSCLPSSALYVLLGLA